MVKQIINVGTVANDGTGDGIRTSFIKVNDMTTEIYTAFGDGTNLLPPLTAVGTPVNNQLGVWTGPSTQEGDANLTWNGTDLSITGNITVTGTLTGAGGGDVTAVGTPLNNQVAVWTGPNAQDGDSNLTFDGTTLIVTGGMTVTSTLTTSVQAVMSSGINAPGAAESAAIKITGISPSVFFEDTTASEDNTLIQSDAGLLRVFRSPFGDAAATPGTEIARFEDAGTAVTTATAVMTREKGDARYPLRTENAMIFIESQVASASATLDFTGFDAAAYESYVFTFTNVEPANDGSSLRILTSTDAGATFATAASDYAQFLRRNRHTALLTEVTDSEDARAFINLADGIGNGAGETGFSGKLNLHSVVTYPVMTWDGSYIDNGAFMWGVAGSARRLSAADVDAVRFLFDSGNMASGKITMYGMRNGV